MKLDKHALLVVFLFIAATLNNVAAVLAHGVVLAVAFDRENTALLVMMGAFGVVSAAGQVTGSGIGSRVLALFEKYEPALAALLSPPAPVPEPSPAPAPAPSPPAASPR